jgi:hypothetical protein
LCRTVLTVMRKLVFNSSMPRSGSELLQVILHQNPSVYGSATSPLLEYQFAVRANYELPEVKSQDGAIMQKAFLSMCKGMADSYYEAITDRPVVVDKNRGWSHYHEWVDLWNPDSKVICMVRDPRSIIASMERVYRKNRHTPSGPDNPAELQNMTLWQRVDHWLDSQPIGLALMRTMDSFQRGVANKMLFVRYEDLTTTPQTELNRVYDFIGEPRFLSHNFSNLIKEVYEDDSHFGVYGNHSVKKELSPCKEADWSDVLPQEVASYIFDKCNWYTKTFKY